MAKNYVKVVSKDKMRLDIILIMMRIMQMIKEKILTNGIIKEIDGHLHLSMVIVAQVAALGHNHLTLVTKRIRLIGEKTIIIYVKVDKMLVGIIIVLVKQIRKYQVHKMIKYQVQLILSV